MNERDTMISAATVHFFSDSIKWPDPLNIQDEVDFACKCGVVRHIRWPCSWKCACGEMWYVDPAGRTWGTQAIKNAHELHGYFADLFAEEPTL